MTTQLNTFPNREAMVQSLAGLIASKLQYAVDSRDNASLIVSGGNTPKSLFLQLAGQPLDWSKVWISLADERWVDATSVDSNEYHVRQILLTGQASQARFIPLKTADEDPQRACKDREPALAVLPSPFDLVLLGMGDDGHTASLFPFAEALDKALDMDSNKTLLTLMPASLPVHAPYPRITMTLPRLLDSRLIVLLLSGSNKFAVYNHALSGKKVMEMPIRAVLRQSEIPVMVYWAP